MYAVIESGGKQMTVSKGDLIKVEKLDASKGDEVTFPVLLVSGEGETLVGEPQVDGAVVTGKVIDQGRSKKVIVFHYKPKKNYRKKAGHRQPFTKVEITGITAPGMKETTVTEETAEPAAAAEASKAEEA